MPKVLHYNFRQQGKLTKTAFAIAKISKTIKNPTVIFLDVNKHLSLYK